MDHDISLFAPISEETWEHIIDYVCGSEMAKVWYEYKFGAPPPEKEVDPDESGLDLKDKAPD
jgi:hypothetical protein